MQIRCLEKITTLPLRRSLPPENQTNNEEQTELDTGMIKGQQSVIWEVAGRRKKGRRVNRKQTMVPGKRMQSDYDAGMLSEEKLDPKGPATLNIKEAFLLGLEQAQESWTFGQMMRHRIWRQ